MLQTGTNLCTILYYATAQHTYQLVHTDKADMHAQPAPNTEWVTSSLWLGTQQYIYTQCLPRSRVADDGIWINIQFFLCVFCSFQHWPSSSFIQAFQPHRIIQYDSGKKALGSEAIIIYCSATTCRKVELGAITSSTAMSGYVASGRT